MARGTIRDYFTPIARSSSNQEANPIPLTSTVPVSNTGPSTSYSSQTLDPNQPSLTSSQDADGRNPNSETQPPRKKLRLTVTNGREMVLKTSQREKKSMRGVKTEESIDVSSVERKEVASSSRRLNSRAKLSMFPSFPVDVILEIFSYLHPIDLIHLMRTTKDLRSLILHRSTTYIWKAAFSNFNFSDDARVVASANSRKFFDLPACPEDIQLAKWASLVWDTFCQHCMASNVHKINFYLRVRYCTRCVKDKSFLERKLKPDKDASNQLILECVPFYHCPPRTHCLIEDKDAFLAELEEVKRLAVEAAGISCGTKLNEEGKVEEIVQKAVDNFVERRAKIIVARKKHADEWNKWQTMNVQLRHRELETIKCERIRKKLMVLGYEREIRFLDNLDKDNCSIIPPPAIKTFGRGFAGWGNEHPQLKVAKSLTEKSWKRIEPELVQWMQEASRLVAQNEEILRIREREALFHQAYLDWRNEPANLEKYPSGVLMPTFADVLGLALGGVGQPSGRYDQEDKDKGGGGWDAHDERGQLRPERDNGNACVALEIGRGLRIVREYVEFGKYVNAEKWREANYSRIENGEMDDVWDDFDDEEELKRKKEVRKKRAERRMKEFEEGWDRVMNSFNDWASTPTATIQDEKTDQAKGEEEAEMEVEDIQEENEEKAVQPPELTPEFARKIIDTKVPDFVDRWRRSKIKSLWERAYSNRDPELDYSHDRSRAIRFPWWDECGKSKRDKETYWGYGYVYHTESERNSYKRYEEYKREELRLKDLQLAVVVFKCNWDGTNHYRVEKKRCIDEGICDEDGETPQGVHWREVKDNSEMCMWYPHFLFHPCTSMRLYRGDEEAAGAHPTFVKEEEYPKFRCAAWEGEEEYFKDSRGWRGCNACQLEFDDKASRAVKSLLQAAGKDEEETTVVDMDEFDARFVCLKCSFGNRCDGERKMRVWSWRDAVQHTLKAHFGDATVGWECLSRSETARAIALERVEGVKRGYLPEYEQKLWKCLRCRDTRLDGGRMTLLQMREHWREVGDHGDYLTITHLAMDTNHPERPGLPENQRGYYRALDYVPRELPPVKMAPSPIGEEEMTEMVKTKEEKLAVKERMRWHRDTPYQEKIRRTVMCSQDMGEWEEDMEGRLPVVVAMDDLNPPSQALELLGTGTQKQSDSMPELYPSGRGVEGLDADRTPATQAITPRNREEAVDVPRNEMFRGSDNVNIGGGSFVSAHTVTMIYQGPSPQSPPPLAQGEAYSEAQPSQPVLTRTLRNLSQKSCHVYWRNLIVKERGSPLWHPEPNNYPEEYKNQGVSIGDVGLLRPSGSFDFLFNICHRSDHPINAGGVPEGFVPLYPPINPLRVEKQNVKGENSWYASQNVIASREEANGELVFESSAEEGAILTLPRGSHSEDLIAMRNVRIYIGDHIRQWYRFVAEQEYEVENGDIRLVTGWDKTSRWGVAAFCSSLNSVRLTFHPQDGLARSYRWQHSGSLDSRTGPSEDPESPGVPQLKNQCVFVRTLNPSFREDVWTALNEDLSLKVGPGSDHLEFLDDQSRPPESVVNTQNTDNYQREYGSFRGHSHQKSRDTSRTMMPHPSRELNDLLWQLVPSETKSTATVMISHDIDWISVLQKGDHGLPERHELFRLIKLFKAQVIDQDGVFFLNYLGDPMQHHSPILEGSLIPNNMKKTSWVDRLAAIRSRENTEPSASKPHRPFFSSAHTTAESRNYGNTLRIPERSSKKRKTTLAEEPVGISDSNSEFRTASVLEMIVDTHERFSDPFRTTYFSEAVAAVRKVDAIYEKSATLSLDEDCVGLVDDTYKILHLCYDSHVKMIGKRQGSSTERKDVAKRLTGQIRQIVASLEEFASRKNVDLTKTLEYRETLQTFLKELHWENIPKNCSIYEAFQIEQEKVIPAKEKGKAMSRNPVKSKSDNYSFRNAPNSGQSLKTKKAPLVEEPIEISDSSSEFSEDTQPSPSNHKMGPSSQQKAGGKTTSKSWVPRRIQTLVESKFKPGRYKTTLAAETETAEEEEERPISTSQHATTPPVSHPPPPYSPPQRTDGPAYAPDPASGGRYSSPWFGPHTPGHGAGVISAAPAPMYPYTADNFQPNAARVVSAPPDMGQFHPGGVHIWPFLSGHQQPGSTITIKDSFNVTNDIVPTKTRRRSTESP